jgi:hypothetical protein
MDGCRWVRAAARAVSHHLCFVRKVLSVASPSSVGLDGDAFVAYSVTTKSAHVMSPSDASVVVVLVIGSVSVMHAFPPLVLALWTLVLVLWTLVLFASGTVGVVLSCWMLPHVTHCASWVTACSFVGRGCGGAASGR